MAPKKRLGDSLIELGLITEDQLKEALTEQKKTNKRLGEVLVTLNFVSENDILKVLSEQLGVPLVNLNEFQIDPEVLKLIPASIAKKHRLMPLFKDGTRLTIAMSDPLDVFAIDQIQYKTNCKIDIVIAASNDIDGAIKQYYGAQANVGEMVETFKPEEAEQQKEAEEARQEEIEDIKEQNPVVKFTNLILKEAVNEGASDIHIEPDEGVLRIRYRVDGVLHQVANVPQNIQNAVISRFKILSGMDIAEKRIPQDGRMNIKDREKGLDIDVRVNTLPCVWGEKIVMRLLDKSSVMIGLENLGLFASQLKIFRQLIREPNGIVLLTGPTGSGKTSTLYAAVNDIKSITVNITTVENPVEYRLKLINQVQTHADIGMTFASALRAILRQDPDVIMIGEIRDTETAEIAVESALTGHLVFSTLHTNDAAGAVTRLLEMGIEPYLLTPTLLCVIAQRLVRRICPKCVKEFQENPDILTQLGLDATKKYYRGEGCVACNKTGYKGRVAIHEMMTFDDEIRKLILKKASSTEIKNFAVEHGMQHLRGNAIQKAQMGLTTLEEVVRITKHD